MILIEKFDFNIENNFRETMNEIHKHEELKKAYQNDASLRSVSNIIGTKKEILIYKNQAFSL